jgi:DNA-binding NtrC family response regulator
MTIYTILIVDDEPLQRRTVRRMLESDFAAEIIEAGDGVEALQLLKNESERQVNLALIDLDMPIMDGLSLLRQTRKHWPRLPCIVLTGSEKMEDAVEAMQLGAADFISKPAQRERLVTSVRNALAIHELKAEVQRLNQDRTPCYRFSDIVAISPGLKEVAVLGQKAASSDIPVLITGESGAGKEIFARAIHIESNRAEKAFVPVNCGALPDNLVESTLFGHEKGAFTGALARAIGKCREADGGVLFLDEVGELKLETQVKLLRMLQQGEIEPVGASKPMKVDVRVISATNRPLEQLVAQGRFREDLYYRLQGLPLHLPPLRERRRDVPVLAEHLLTRIAHSEERAEMQLSQGAKDWLMSYGWPGNVRELQHILHRAVLLTEAQMLEAEDLSCWAQARGSKPTGPQKADAANVVQLEDASGQFKTLEQIEQEVIEAALARFGAHIGRAAAALGVGQSTLYKRMKKNPAA